MYQTIRGVRAKAAAPVTTPAPKAAAAVAPKLGANAVPTPIALYVPAPNAVVVATFAAVAPPAIAAAVPAAAPVAIPVFDNVSCSETICLFSVRVFDESYFIINFTLSNASNGLYLGCTIIFFYKYIVITKFDLPLPL